MRLPLLILAVLAALALLAGLQGCTGTVKWRVDTLGTAPLPPGSLPGFPDATPPPGELNSG
jgi:hypothetical protein